MHVSNNSCQWLAKNDPPNLLITNKPSLCSARLELAVGHVKRTKVHNALNNLCAWLNNLSTPPESSMAILFVSLQLHMLCCAVLRCAVVCTAA